MPVEGHISQERVGKSLRVGLLAMQIWFCWSRKRSALGERRQDWSVLAWVGVGPKKSDALYPIQFAASVMSPGKASW
jgi:hypothetical protein